MLSHKFNRMDSVAKRIMDLTAAAFGLILVSPLIIVLATVIRIFLGSPIFFRQQRPGLHCNPFIFYKFRTMTAECDEAGCLLPDECRLTALGKFLRRTSLDELPQLWNVLKGDMSLVGPRPLLMEYLPLYTAHQMRRHEVRPGITGWAQVNGRNELSWEKKFDLDVWYVDNWSLKLDFKILLLTAKAVLARSGINRTGHATMTKFSGYDCK